MNVYVLIKPCEVDRYGYWLGDGDTMGVFTSLEAATQAVQLSPLWPRRVRRSAEGSAVAWEVYGQREDGTRNLLAYIREHEVHE